MLSYESLLNVDPYKELFSDKNKEDASTVTEDPEDEKDDNGILGILQALMSMSNLFGGAQSMGPASGVSAISKLKGKDSGLSGIFKNW